MLRRGKNTKKRGKEEREEREREIWRERVRERVREEEGERGRERGREGEDYPLSHSCPYFFSLFASIFEKGSTCSVLQKKAG
jgi:hypothetical protein